MKSLRRFIRSRRGMNTIIAEVMMVLIVIIMSAIVFVYASGLFGSLLGNSRIHPEDFRIVAAGAPSAGGFDPASIQPGGTLGSFSTSGYVCTSSSPVTTVVTTGVYVPPGQSCTISAGVTGGVRVDYGASLTVQGGVTVSGGIQDNRSASISIQSSTVSGNMNLYGTGSLTLTSSTQQGGNVQLDGVKYASFSSTPLGGNFQATNSGSVQVDSNNIGGNVLFSNDKVVRLTNNAISGTLTFITDPNCYMAGNTTHNVIGTCAGGSPSGGLDIANTGQSIVSFRTVYLNSQPWNGVLWQLGSGSTEQCGGLVIPVGPCASYPVVIPPGMMVHISFTWVSPDPNAQFKIAMWTAYNNYLEARVDPTAGLVCSTRSLDAPQVPIGFC